MYASEENVTNDRFIELAEKRTQRILDALRLLGNLSNRSNYAYREKDYEKIFRTIKKDLRECEARFAGREVESKKFKLR